MAQIPLIFLRLNSAGEVYKGSVPPIDNRGTLVTTLQPGEKLTFTATATEGQASLFSVAANWPGSICGPYFVDQLGALGDKTLKDRGLWFKPPIAGTPVPVAVKFTFDGSGLLTSESGNRTVQVNIAELARRNAQGTIIEHAEHYVAILPEGAGKVAFTFEEAAHPAVALDLRATLS